MFICIKSILHIANIFIRHIEQCFILLDLSKNTASDILFYHIRLQIFKDLSRANVCS